MNGEQRKRLLKRAKGLCEACSNYPDFRGLVVHHIGLKGMGGTKLKYEDKDLLVLCGTCHAKVHGLREA